MSEDEIAAQAWFQLGGNQFLDQMMDSADGRPYPGDEAVADAWITLLRGGIGTPEKAARRPARRAPTKKTRRVATKRKDGTE